MFSQTLSIPAAEEAIYSDELVDADPESLTQLNNWNYDPPAWFVSNAAELELASEDMLDTELPLDDAEPEIVADSDVDSDVAADAIASATKADPASQIPMPGPNDPPLTPKQQRARALLFAEAELAAALAELRERYEAQLLNFNPAAELTDLSIGSALEKLNRVRGTKILLAGRWLQNAPPRDEPEPIWVQWPSALADDGSDPATARYADPERFPRERSPQDRFPRDRFAEEFADKPEPSPVLEGWLAVTLGRYLHLDLDIAFVDPEQPQLLAPAGADANDAFNGAAQGPQSRPEFELGSSAISATDLRQPIDATGPRDPLGRAASQLPELTPPMPRTATPAGMPAGMQGGVASGAQPDAPLAESLPVQPALIRLKQHRRLRSAELHYLDHPRLGVLVRIDPIKLDERTQAALARVKALR